MSDRKPPSQRSSERETQPLTPAAVARDASAHTPAATVARKRLGDILVEAGLVTRGQLEAALHRQRTDKRRLGVLLVEAGNLTSVRLSQTLSHQLCLPWVSLASVPISDDLLEIVPASIAREHQLFPVYVKRGFGAKDILYVATDDPTRDDALAACARAVGMRVRAVVAASDDLDAALVRYYRASLEMNAVPRPAITAPEIPAVKREDAERAVARSTPQHNDPIGASMAAIVPRPPTLPPRPMPALDEVDPDDVEMIEAITDPPPARPSRAPRVVLLVNPARSLVRECRLAASPLGVLVVVTDLSSLRQKVGELSPLAIVLTDDVYAFDRVSFSTLALESGSPLVIWSDDLDSAYLEPVFATALRSADAR